MVKAQDWLNSKYPNKENTETIIYEGEVKLEDELIIRDYPNLKEIIITNSPHLTSLRMVNCHHLISLNCADNGLTNLLLDNCLNAEEDCCVINQLTKLDCSHNSLTILDLSKNSRVVEINSANNPLTNLILPANTTRLKYLNVANTNIDSKELEKLKDCQIIQELEAQVQMEIS